MTKWARRRGVSRGKGAPIGPFQGICRSAVLAILQDGPETVRKMSGRMRKSGIVVDGVRFRRFLKDMVKDGLIKPLDVGSVPEGASVPQWYRVADRLMLKPQSPIALPCRLSQGAVPGERVFEVVMADGTRHLGISPRYFCWDSAGRPAGEDEPCGVIRGMIAARVVDQLDGDQFSVEVPDGEVIAVLRAVIRARPTAIEQPGVSPGREG